MRRRLVCVAILVLGTIGVVAPAEAGTQVREVDHQSVVVLGVDVYQHDGFTTQTCNDSAVDPILCAILLAVTPVHLHLGNGDTHVILDVDAAKESEQPPPPPEPGEIVIPLPEPIGTVTIPIPVLQPIPLPTP
jgi:hypothetical protein